MVNILYEILIVQSPNNSWILILIILSNSRSIFDTVSSRTRILLLISNNLAKQSIYFRPTENTKFLEITVKISLFIDFTCTVLLSSKSTSLNYIYINDFPVPALFTILIFSPSSNFTSKKHNKKGSVIDF